MKRFTKKMEMAQEKTKSLIALFEDNHHSLIADAIFFRNCTYAAKKAAKEVGLEFKYGMLVTGNNLYHCRYLYFPGKESIWVKNGNRYDSFCLSDISIVYIQREKCPKDVLYKLRVIDTVKEDVYSIDELVQKFIDLSQQREKNDA